SSTEVEEDFSQQHALTIAKVGGENDLPSLQQTLRDPPYRPKRQTRPFFYIDRDKLQGSIVTAEIVSTTELVILPGCQVLPSINQLSLELFETDGLNRIVRCPGDGSLPVGWLII